MSDFLKTYKSLQIHKSANFLGNLNCDMKQNQSALLMRNIIGTKEYKECMYFVSDLVIGVKTNKLCPSGSGCYNTNISPSNSDLKIICTNRKIFLSPNICTLLKGANDKQSPCDTAAHNKRE
jgi:hypothetical protein